MHLSSFNVCFAFFWNVIFTTLVSLQACVCICRTIMCVCLILDM
ncbi:unnamed protein product [Brassica rapa]|uniref:Uncharacterized protein n=1 Tax=Brassica campestris TaxID=3711 RepID=A0A8D9H798_BRACM|nr:unnamed protein product [Brassica rapa]